MEGFFEEVEELGAGGVEGIFGGDFGVGVGGERLSEKRLGEEGEEMGGEGMEIEIGGDEAGVGGEEFGDAAGVGEADDGDFGGGDF